MQYTVSPVILKKSKAETSTVKIGSALKPLRARYLHEAASAKFNQQLITFNDGISFYNIEAFKNCKDSIATNNTTMVLTNRSTWNSFLQNNSEKEENNEVLSRLNTTLFFYAFLQFQATTSTPPVFLRLKDNKIEFSETLRNLCKINKVGTDKVQIQIVSNNDEKYILAVNNYTATPVVEAILERDISFNHITEFNYNLYQDNRISLFFEQQITQNPDVLYQLRFNRATSNKTHCYIGFFQNRLTIESLIKPKTTTFKNNNKYPSQFKEFTSSTFLVVNPGYKNHTRELPVSAQNKWVGYYNELFDKTNNTNVEINKKITIENVPVNYLTFSNLLTQIDQTNNTITYNLLPLKTMYTPEQELFSSIATNIDGVITLNTPKNLQPIRRTYTKIFTTNNSIEPLQKTSLSYTSGTRELQFPPGEKTYFHYSIVLPQIPISQAGIIESGAFPGPIPEVADKIFIENTEYNNEYTNRNRPPLLQPNGAFVCAWLSGSESSSISGIENSVWMDRWYDSSNVKEISAFSKSTNVLVSDLKTGVFYDTPSKLVFEPNSYYFYDRTSNNKIKNYLNNTLDAGTTNIHSLLQVNQSSIIDSKGNFVSFTSNSPIIFDTSDSERESSYVINLNGETTGIISSLNKKLFDDNCTASLWVKTDSWVNNPGATIISRDFRSGWKIEASCGISTDLVSIGEAKYNHILNINKDLEFISDNIIPDKEQEFCLNDIVHTEDLYTFGIDNCSKQLYKFDLNSDLVDLITFTDVDEITASKLVYGPDKLLYLKLNNKLLAINPDLNTQKHSVSSISQDFTASNFVFDLNHQIFSGDFIDAVVDNNNYVWYISACPPSFFTLENQPETNVPFFDNTQTNIDALTADGDLNYIFVANTIEGTSTAKPIVISNLHGENITFPTLFPNNLPSDVISKFFQPQKLLIDKENNLYIANDTDDILKLVLSKDAECGLLYTKNIFRRKTIGNNIYNLPLEIFDKITTYNTTIANENKPAIFRVSETSEQWIRIKDIYTNSKTSFTLGYENIQGNNTTVIFFLNNKDKYLYKLDTQCNVLDCINLLPGFNRKVAPSIDLATTQFNRLYTLYDWQRKFKYLTYENGYALRVNFNTITPDLNKKEYTLVYNKNLTDNEWYHISFTLNKQNSIATLFINGLPVDTVSTAQDEALYYDYSSNICLGSRMGRLKSLNNELSTNKNVFKGQIDDVKIYNFSATVNNIALQVLSKYKIPPLFWNITTRSTSFLEQISRYYIHNLPGFKSNIFNLYIANSKITGTNKARAENSIRQNINELIPANTTLNDVIWID